MQTLENQQHMSFEWPQTRVSLKHFNKINAYEFIIDHPSYTHNLNSCQIKARKKSSPEWDSNPQSDQLPDGLIAQSVERYTSIAEVMGSNPIQA